MTTTPPPARPAGPTRRRGATRERLLDAAYETFAQVGVAQSSIEAICEAAGFTRGAFYSNFSSKEELFLALADREIHARIDALEDVVERVTSDPALLAAGCARREVARSRGEGVPLAGTTERPIVQAILAEVMADVHGDRQWHQMNLEFELLALREAEVAQAFADLRQAYLTRVADVLERILARLQLRLRTAPLAAAQILIAGYVAAAREVYIAGRGEGDRSSGAAGSDGSTETWFTALIELVVEPD